MAFVKFRIFVTECPLHTKRRGAIGRAVTRIAVVMFRSYFVGNKRSRQKFLGYLGAYYLAEAGDVERVAEFWQKIDGRLDALDISFEDRAKAVAAIASRVPRPSKQQLDAAARHGAKAMVRVERAMVGVT
jgi:hypothetical protein